MSALEYETTVIWTTHHRSHVVGCAEQASARSPAAACPQQGRDQRKFWRPPMSRKSKKWSVNRNKYPLRNIAEANSLTPAQIASLQGKVVYVCSGHHKTKPFRSGPDASWVNPAWRGDRTPCDRPPYPQITENAAQRLLLNGLKRCMVDAEFAEDVQNGNGRGFPKHIWAVYNKHVFEANCPENSSKPVYHGYPRLPRISPSTTDIHCQKKTPCGVR